MWDFYNIVVIFDFVVFLVGVCFRRGGLVLSSFRSQTFLNGDKYVGEFKENEPWNITVYDKNGNLIEKVVNGEWIER